MFRTQARWFQQVRQGIVLSQELEQIVDSAWEARAEINYETRGEVRAAVEEAMRLLDSGTVRVAEKSGDGWIVHQWLKRRYF